MLLCDMNKNLKHGFKVGDGVTVHGYSDAYAYTVIGVTPATIRIQRDNAKLLNGCNSGEADALKFSPGGFVGHTSGQQRYEYTPNTGGEILVARLQKKPFMRYTKGAGTDYPGAYGYVAEPAFKTGGNTVTAGRSEHYDFNF